MTPYPTVWFASPKPNSRARLRLFCFPYAGGGVAGFSTWPANLPSTTEVRTVQLPGRESRLREQPYTELQALVETLADAIQPYLDLPFTFFGHSMGSLIGFELARKLRARQWPMPILLFVSGRRAPHIPDSQPPLYSRPESTFIEGLVERYNGVPAAVLQDPELLQIFLPVLRADITMIETYCYRDEPALSCPISAFGGVQDPQVTPQTIEAWKRHTQGTFHSRMFPGDHFYFKPGQLRLLKAMTHDLAETFPNWDLPYAA